jgi:hypothetical protein
MGKVEEAYATQMTKLFPDIKVRLHPYNRAAGALDNTYIASLLYEPKAREIIQKVKDIANKLKDEQHAITAKQIGKVTPCGVRLPLPGKAKAVLADPTLKALVDSVTEG